MFHTLLEATAPAGDVVKGAGGGMTQMLITFGLMFAVFYFLIIRPQQKKQKETQKMLDNLQVHAKVFTSAGIIGKIVAFKENKNVVVLRVDDLNNVKLEFQRQAIAGVLSESKEEETKEEKSS
ncbi:MAG: preprotein translocase subunit YajC [Candidatus Cloacimonetes bacterium]|nr:preprotein translocase subunit YajC [Candidatus Cloacimonadota bacterium]